MCYLIEKSITIQGVAPQMTHGQHLADFKERLGSLVQDVGYDEIQLITISRPSA